MSTTIANGCVVNIHYHLTLEDGSVADSSRDGDPLAYLHGAHNLVPGLERQLTGRKPGDKFTAEVPPADGYGDYDPQGDQSVPKSAFPNGMKLAAGMMFHTEEADGSAAPLWIKDVRGDQVDITSNHPLAGRTLTFEIEVVSVRKATKEELTHGHVHGPGGHAH